MQAYGLAGVISCKRLRLHEIAPASICACTKPPLQSGGLGGAPQGAGGGRAAQNKAVGLGRSSRTSAEDLINAKAAIKRASVLYSCLMHAIITRYMHTNSTLGVSAGCPHTSVSRMTFGAGNWKLILRKPDDRAPAWFFTVA